MTSLALESTPDGYRSVKLVSTAIIRGLVVRLEVKCGSYRHFIGNVDDKEKVTARVNLHTDRIKEVVRGIAARLMTIRDGSYEE